MRVITTFYTPTTGWHSPLPNDMDSLHTLIMIFGNPDIEQYQPQLQEIREVFPLAIMTGCSSFASIAQDKIFDDGFTISITQFEQTTIKLAFTILQDSADSYAGGRRIGQQLAAPDLRGVIILADGVYTRGTALIHGITHELGTQINMVGGLASDKETFKKNWVLNGSKKMPRAVCGIGLYGKYLGISTRAKDGWHPFGLERTVTRSQGHTLYELDHYPALALYQEYLGKRANDLPQSALHFPLAVWHKDRKNYIIRAVLAVDEATHSLRCAGEIPEGSCAQLMYACSENLVEGAEEAAIQIRKQLPACCGALWALAISCYGRKVIMQEESDQELEAILEQLPAGTQQIGFYSYGELAPNQDLGICSLYNETMTLTVIYEADDAL